MSNKTRKRDPSPPPVSSSKTARLTAVRGNVKAGRRRSNDSFDPVLIQLLMENPAEHEYPAHVRSAMMTTAGHIPDEDKLSFLTDALREQNTALLWKSGQAEAAVRRLRNYVLKHQAENLVKQITNPAEFDMVLEVLSTYDEEEASDDSSDASSESSDDEENLSASNQTHKNENGTEGQDERRKPTSKPMMAASMMEAPMQAPRGIMTDVSNSHANVDTEMSAEEQRMLVKKVNRAQNCINTMRKVENGGRKVPSTPTQVKKAVSSIFKDPQDLYVTYVMNKNAPPPAAAQRGFDYTAAYLQAMEMWEALSAEKQNLWRSRQKQLLNGNINMIRDFKRDADVTAMPDAATLTTEANTRTNGEKKRSTAMTNEQDSLRPTRMARGTTGHDVGADGRRIKAEPIDAASGYQLPGLHSNLAIRTSASPAPSFGNPPVPAYGGQFSARPIPLQAASIRTLISGIWSIGPVERHMLFPASCYSSKLLQGRRRIVWYAAAVILQ